MCLISVFIVSKNECSLFSRNAHFLLEPSLGVRANLTSFYGLFHGSKAGASFSLQLPSRCPTDILGTLESGVGLTSQVLGSKTKGSHLFIYLFFILAKYT